MAFDSKKSKGFTLIETLVALALISVISFVVMGALAPWVGFKQKLDTERKINDLRQGIESAYKAQAMAVDTTAGAKFFDLEDTVPDADGRCTLDPNAFSTIATYFSGSPQQLVRDGYNNNWCVFVTPPLSAMRDGVTLWFRNIAVISGGLDGVLDAGTVFDKATGVLTVGGDDQGFVVSGREIQAQKLTETMRRVSRIAQMYETYFTTRYLATASRDITIYYFSNTYDPSGVVETTAASWQPVSIRLASIGVGGADALSAWELNNAIQLNNSNGTMGGLQVRSPATTGTGVLPYTAMLRVQLPSPPSVPVPYFTQVVVGNY